MSDLTTIFVILGITIFVLGLSRSLPISGLRRGTVIILRVVGIVCAVLAAKGLAYSTTQTQPRHLIYLVDQSASIDPAQTEWMARRLASLEAIRPAHVSRAVLVFGRDSRAILPPGHERLRDPARIRRLLEDAPIQRNETNVEAALLAVLGTVSSPARPGPPTGSQVGAGTPVGAPGRQAGRVGASQACLRQRHTEAPRR